MNNRGKMCNYKLSFNTRKKAQVNADKHGQSVYECPVCYCWHCTSKENWRDEFVNVEEFNYILEKNKEILEKNKKMRDKLEALQADIQEKREERNNARNEVNLLRRQLRSEV